MFNDSTANFYFCYSLPYWFCLLTILWGLCIPTPCSHFSLDRKVTKRSTPLHSRADQSAITTTPDALRKAAARRRMSFMFGCVNLFLRRTLLNVCKIFSNVQSITPHKSTTMLWGSARCFAPRLRWQWRIFVLHSKRSSSQLEN